MARPRPWWALFVASAVLAGCLGGNEGLDASPNPTGIQHVEEDQVQTTTRPIETQDVGVLVVKVTDVNEQPVPKAFVALAGTLHSSETNGTGEARFPDLEPGRYAVRVDADAFLSAEVNVTVAAAQEKAIVVALETVPGFVEGGAGHFHDYWNGATEVTLFQDASWDIRCYATYCFNSQNQAIRNWALPPGATIYPGTGEIQLTAKWSGTSTMPIWLTMGGPGFSYSGRQHKFTTSGESVKYSIGPENTDAPHAQTSAWFVRFYETIDHNQGYFAGPLLLTLKIFRGAYELPFDPPHPDEWQGRNSVRIVEKSLHYGIACYRWAYTGEQTCQAIAAAGYNGPVDTFFAKKVLNGAGKLEVRIRMNTTTAMTAQGPSFEYNPGRPSSFSTAADVWVRPPSPTIEGNLYKWDIPVNPSQWDPFYAKNSKWQWRVRLYDDRTADQGVLIADLHFTIDVVKA